jgi:cyclic lactone autoinducer peptide
MTKLFTNIGPWVYDFTKGGACQMKKRVSKIMAVVSKRAAQKSANAVTDWVYYQPVVPAKLKQEK